MANFGRPVIKSLVVGHDQELSFDGEVFYSGPALPLLPTLNVIRDHFHIGLPEARASWRVAEKEVLSA